jgi:hypothetical protein
MGQPTNPSFNQQSFRFRFDNGSETTAPWAAAVNTNITFRPYTIFRCRFLVQQTVSAANQNLGPHVFKLRYSLNGGAYTDVGAQGSVLTPIRYANSPNVTDGTATTQQLGAGSFIAGAIDEDGAQSETFTNGALSETEIEYVLELYPLSLTASDFIDLRVYYSTSTALNTYTSTPRVQRPKRRFVMG